MSFRVFLVDGALSFEVEDGETVLDAALRQAVPLAHECRFGGCGSCRIQLMQGRVRYDEAPLALSEAEAQAGQALACQARPLEDLVIGRHAGDAVLAQPERRLATVQDIQRLTSDITCLRLRLDDGEPLRFEAGQYLKVYPGDGSHRSFSMARSPASQEIELHVRRIPGGRFTDQLLPQWRRGQQLEVELPLGQFRLDRQAWRPLLMVATGTGLAPIRSMLETLLDDPDCPPVWLYWGMREPADLYLDAEIRSWAHRLYEFTYVPVLSRAGDSWQGRRGHVQQAVIEDLPDLSEHAIYLCGSPDMIHDAKPLFVSHGAQIEHLHADGFSFQHATCT